MRVSILLVLGALGFAQQDDWRPLRLARLDSLPDSIQAAGLSVTPEPGAIEIKMGLDRTCRTKPAATFQSQGAVVKVRVAGVGAGPGCRALSAPQGFTAHVAGLKPKRYQVILYTEDAKGRWRPWRAAVTTVP